LREYDLKGSMTKNNTLQNLIPLEIMERELYKCLGQKLNLAAPVCQSPL
jgi:hypothetical protein